MGRALWGLGRLVFRLVPRPFFELRSRILRIFGARIGRDVHIYPSAVIYLPWLLDIGDHSAIGEDALIYNLGQVSIGSRVTISHRAHVCAGTHDYTDASLPLIRANAWIEDEAWVCADAFVGPGVRVGAGGIVAARAVAVKDVEAGTIVAGNPARFVKHRYREVS